MKLFLRAFLFAVLFACTFSVYSGMRTWSETVGFNLKNSLASLAIAFVFDLPIFFIALAAFGKGYLGNANKLAAFALVSLGIILGAAILSEWSITRDETSFILEAKSSSQNPFSRPRAWPNTDCTLVYSPPKGVWATE